MATTHRYWRVYVTAVNGSSIVGLTELEFRSSSGGADLTGAGTAISGGDFSGTLAKAKAFDNGAGEWASNALPGWIGYDFGGSPVDVVEISIKIRTTDPANDVLQSPKTFSVDYSDDGVTFVPVWFESNITTWTDGSTIVFTADLGVGLEATKAQTYGVVGAPLKLSTTKAQTYGVLGPPLLVSCTKAVMYVITGPDDGRFQRIKVRYLRAHQ